MLQFGSSSASNAVRSLVSASHDNRAKGKHTGNTLAERKLASVRNNVARFSANTSAKIAAPAKSLLLRTLRSVAGRNPQQSTVPTFERSSGTRDLYIARQGNIGRGNTALEAYRSMTVRSMAEPDRQQTRVKNHSNIRSSTGEMPAIERQKSTRNLTGNSEVSDSKNTQAGVVPSEKTSAQASSSMLVGQKLVPQGMFEVIKCTPSGDCLFEAAIRSTTEGASLNKEQGSLQGANLRDELSQHVKEFKSEISKFTAQFGVEFTDLENLLSTPRAWNDDAGDLVFPLLAHKLGKEVKICIEGDDKKYQVLQTLPAFNKELGVDDARSNEVSPSEQGPLWVLKQGDNSNGGGHYDCLLPKRESKPASQPAGSVTREMPPLPLRPGNTAKEGTSTRVNNRSNIGRSNGEMPALERQKATRKLHERSRASNGESKPSSTAEMQAFERLNAIRNLPQGSRARKGKSRSSSTGEMPVLERQNATRNIPQGSRASKGKSRPGSTGEMPVLERQNATRNLPQGSRARKGKSRPSSTGEMPVLERQNATRNIPQGSRARKGKSRPSSTGEMPVLKRQNATRIATGGSRASATREKPPLPPRPHQSASGDTAPINRLGAQQEADSSIRKMPPLPARPINTANKGDTTPGQLEGQPSGSVAREMPPLPPRPHSTASEGTSTTNQPAGEPSGSVTT